MAQIEVTIMDQTGAKITSVELPDNVPMKRLVPLLVTKMNLPTSQGGQHISYYMDHKRTGNQLGENDTLRSRGIRKWDIMVLGPSVVAGCFLEGTMIAATKDTCIPIEQVSTGSSILTFDLAAQQLSMSRVTAVMESTTGCYYLINGCLPVTGTHPIFMDGEWLPAAELAVGDHLTTLNCGRSSVTSIEFVEVPSPVPIYNLHLQTNHTFFAEGILLHNAASKTANMDELLGQIQVDDPLLSIEEITRKALFFCLAVLLLSALTLWLLNRFDDRIILKIIGYSLSGFVTLSSARAFILAYEDRQRSLNPRVAMLLFLAFSVLTLELLLSILMT